MVKYGSFHEIHLLTQLEVASTDKKLLLFDLRSMDGDNSIQVKNAFEGTKSSQVFFIPRLNWIHATGFSKQAKRELNYVIYVIYQNHHI